MGLSVSRVGGAAQTRAIKKTAGTLRIDQARLRELEVFTQFASELDPATQQALDHGRRRLELLPPPLAPPRPVSRQASLLYVATRGLVDDVPLEHVRPFVLGFADKMEAELPDVVAEIESTGTTCRWSTCAPSRWALPARWRPSTPTWWRRLSLPAP